MASILSLGSTSSSTSTSTAAGGETVRVPLAPSAGFCIKSITTESGFYTYVDGSSSSSNASSSSSNPNFLEPTPKPSARTLQIPRGMKVFLNIAWDKRVPSPPEVGEEVVKRAMAGADLDLDQQGYYVPVVVSEPREDLDKKGQSSIVFDCVFSASLKSRCLKDKEFKLYLIELALEHVEDKAHTTLSRQVGTPNITSKGKLEPRTVLMPRALVDPDFARTSASSANTSNQAQSQRKAGNAALASPLIQEIATPDGSGSANKDPESRDGGANDITNANTNAGASWNKTKQPKKSILKSSSASPSSTLAANSVSGAVAISSGTAAPTSAGGGKERPLIQEVSTSNRVDSDSGSRPDSGRQRANESGSSLGDGAGVDAKENVDSVDSMDVKTLSALPPLRWKWENVDDPATGSGPGGIKVEVDVPELTREVHVRSTLDVEPRRILLHIPYQYFLDINLDLSDEQIGKMGEVTYSVEDRGDNINVDASADAEEQDVKVSIAESMQVDSLRVRGHNAGEALRLKKHMHMMQKRERDGHNGYFDVENARAEWRVGEKKLVIIV